LRETRDTERFLADLAGNSKAMSDYLVGEILSGLPADTCDLLRAVSICDQLAAGLAAAVSGRPDAGEVLAALEQETSLVLTVGVWGSKTRLRVLACGFRRRVRTR
jgi:LuxR family maltose regulon positive regulatory protein